MAGTKVKIELNSAGVRQLLRSPEAVGFIEGVASRIAARAGAGHSVLAGAGVNRARATVRTETYDAKMREAKSRSLSSAIAAGRA